ncbi:Retrovirus-related Pol polyprotein from transposon RE2 [Vitis vinifera]|uniref:Retrovirus-related Pol polyprotein from transposon RE2 n=1 Tax=Vitis vinifera TaxID=29760 RepID=A0A438EUT1_VITVI|nr:Retrovirus-related Pol polyprotein from transposon RE2 [Vitis vinifera]
MAIAMQDEYDALIKNMTWNLVPFPAHGKVIGCKWLDIQNEFLHGDLTEEVFMMQPSGFVLPEFPNHWSFTSFLADSSMFIYKSGYIFLIILIYVDDIIVTGTHSKSISQLILSLGHHFAIKDLGTFHYFLGIELHRSTSGLHLSQHKYITNLLARTSMTDSKPFHSPMASGSAFSIHDETSLEDGTAYRSVAWAIRMAVHLKALDLWETVEEDYEVLPLGDNPSINQMKIHRERKTMKAKAKACLFSTVSPSILTRIMELDKTTVSKVRIGNGEYISTRGKGTVAIESLSGLKLIPDVLFVPNIDQNLLSVGQVLEKGFKVLFEDKFYMIKDANRKYVFKIKMRDKSFALNLLEEEQAAIS